MLSLYICRYRIMFHDSEALVNYNRQTLVFGGLTTGLDVNFYAGWKKIYI